MYSSCAIVDETNPYCLRVIGIVTEVLLYNPRQSGCCFFNFTTKLSGDRHHTPTSVGNLHLKSFHRHRKQPSSTQTASPSSSSCRSHLPSSQTVFIVTVVPSYRRSSLAASPGHSRIRSVVVPLYSSCAIVDGTNPYCLRVVGIVTEFLLYNPRQSGCCFFNFCAKLSAAFPYFALDCSADDAASIMQRKPKLTLTRPKEPEFETVQRVRSVGVKSSAELEEEMMAKIPKFKAHPLNKKILEASTLPALPKSTPPLPEFQVNCFLDE
ncbi:hypothetical protein F0562_015404 [Nyssa sinensis]|uniref:TPX2 central domain-containing protein n=1 Tax=Nyssa sinensis TaxID=561372 RepID=A0A5J4ZH91_9ASTE|nr:hypothetical protein F0562_015404 [Nyssa sinensis]